MRRRKDRYWPDYDYVVFLVNTGPLYDQLNLIFLTETTYLFVLLYLYWRRRLHLRLSGECFVDEMATRGLATKDLLGHPDSVLDAKWLEAYHAGDALWAVLGGQGG